MNVFLAWLPNVSWNIFAIAVAHNIAGIFTHIMFHIRIICMNKLFYLSFFYVFFARHSCPLLFPHLSVYIFCFFNYYIWPICHNSSICVTLDSKTLLLLHIHIGLGAKCMCLRAWVRVCVCVCVCVQFVCRFDAYCFEGWVMYTCTNFVLSHTVFILLQNRAPWCYVVNTFPKFIIISSIIIIYCYLIQLLLYTYCHSHGSYFFSLPIPFINFLLSVK